MVNHLNADECILSNKYLINIWIYESRKGIWELLPPFTWNFTIPELKKKKKEVLVLTF
jgi:hypothetical protein